MVSSLAFHLAFMPVREKFLLFSGIFMVVTNSLPLVDLQISDGLEVFSSPTLVDTILDTSTKWVWVRVLEAPDLWLICLGWWVFFTFPCVGLLFILVSPLLCSGSRDPQEDGPAKALICCLRWVITDSRLWSSSAKPLRVANLDYPGL